MGSWQPWIIDGVIVVMLVLAARGGYRRGLVNQIIWFASSLVALLVALRWSGTLADLIGSAVYNYQVTVTICFILLFVVVVYVMHLLGNLLTRVLNFTVVGLANAVLGAVFSALVTLVFIVAGLTLLLMLVPKANDTLKQTYVAGPLATAGKTIMEERLLHPIEERFGEWRQ